MTIDVLHPLIHSLSVSEKRYWRLMTERQAGNKGFLRLFDCLLQHETLGDALTADITRQFPDATLEPARKHLYRTLMQCLRQFEGGKRIDVRVSQLLQDSQILYERGLVRFSQKQLEKARALAEEHEQWPYAVLAARQQLEQWVRWQFDDIDELTLTRQHAMIRQHIDRTQTALNHAALYETLLLRYRTQGMVGQDADIMRLNDLLLEEYQLLNRQKQKSFVMQQQHLHFQSAYLRMIGDETGSLRVYHELDALFQDNPRLWVEQPLYYVQLLEGILTDLRLLERYDDMPFFIDRLQRIDTNVQELQRTILYVTLYHSLLRLVDQRQYEEAAALLQTHWLPDASPFERGLDQLPLATRAEFDLLLVRLHVGQGHLSTGLQRLNRVLARSARLLPRTLYAQSRLLHLLLHAQLGNTDYLNYALRSVERKLTGDRLLTTGEQLVLTLLRQWLKGKLRKKAVWQLDTFRTSLSDRQLLGNLDIRQWVEAVCTSV